MSVKAGERVLLPSVRKAGTETIIVADGFNCREQIEQQIRRKAMHLAEVLQLALKEEKEKSTQTIKSPADKKAGDKKILAVTGNKE
ncbi:MAG: hypothetical protein ABI480_02275 [Chitinophagaceae bacterium]